MERDVAQALNSLNKRINEVQKQVEDFLLDKHDTNVDAITTVEDAVLELAGIAEELSLSHGEETSESEA